MARHKSFGSSNPYADSEPVTFEIYDETFTCFSAVQGATLLRLGRDTTTDPSQAVMNFFASCMSADEFERFNELLTSEDKIVDASTLGEIAGFLVGEYSTRPTERSSSSRPSPVTSGRSSGRKR